MDTDNEKIPTSVCILNPSVVYALVSKGVIKDIFKK